MRNKIGIITRGSLLDGVEMTLDAAESVEDIKAGRFVVVEGDKHDFFSLITDIRLDATSDEVLRHPPGRDDEVLRKVLQGTATFATVSLRPMLMMASGEATLSDKAVGEPQPVKTVPAHFSLVADATEEDVARIFGSETADGRFFNLGSPLDMDSAVCLNLNRFVERSNGIFGKTGTGKTFLTRLVLSGIIKSRKAVNLVFDMHNEYGHKGMKETGTGQSSFVKGLKQIFPDDVAIFSLDPESSRQRRSPVDHEVVLYADQIEVEDVLPLQGELALHATAMESAYVLRAHFGKAWLRTLVGMNAEQLEQFSRDSGAHIASLMALQRKLSRLKSFPFIKMEPMGRGQTDVLERFLTYLDSGEKSKHVVLEFGRQTSMLAYLLVANILTRRIHDHYLRRSEAYFATQNPADQPRQLVITIEEAHKFLNPAAAKQTIFGIIAREMRKYYVSLLVVDQRPSGIDEEVMSQLGTKIVALLNDEKDINAVLTGVSGAAGLRSVLASLDSKQQALVLGHAVPMPVVVRTRAYDEQFYRDMGGPVAAAATPEARHAAALAAVHDLF